LGDLEKENIEDECGETPYEINPHQNTSSSAQNTAMLSKMCSPELGKKSIKRKKLESSQSPHTSAKAMLFARWQHHLRFCSGFPYATLKAIVTKISK